MKFCGVLSEFRLSPVLDWSAFMFTFFPFSTVSCTDEGSTSIHERTLAGRPGSWPIISSHLISEALTGFTSFSCVNNGEGIPASRVSVASDAATSLKSVLKLYLLEGKLIGVCWVEISHSAKPATDAGIDAGDTWFCLRSVRKSRTTIRQPQEVATRLEMEE